MAPYSPEACQASFERLAAWVDNSLAMHQPELSQVRAEDKKLNHHYSSAAVTLFAAHLAAR